MLSVSIRMTWPFLLTTRTGQRLPQLTVQADQVIFSISFAAALTAATTSFNGKRDVADKDANPVSRLLLFI